MKLETKQDRKLNYIDKELRQLGVHPASDAYDYIRKEAIAASEILKKNDVLDLIVDLVSGPLALPQSMFFHYEDED